MPVHRDKDGRVIDVLTRKTLTPKGKRGKPGARTVDISSPVVPAQPAKPVLGQGWSAKPTEVMAKTGLERATVVHRSSSRGPMDDPPVGWLVVVDGPGMGSVATLGIGSNSIGRDPEANRVALDHGDDMISRSDHGVVVYDSENRKFWIRHGDGTNLMYVNDEPVLSVQPLEPVTHIRLGRTVLRFVPLCGEAFSWPDDKSEED